MNGKMGMMMPMMGNPMMGNMMMGNNGMHGGMMGMGKGMPMNNGMMNMGAQNNYHQNMQNNRHQSAYPGNDNPANANKGKTSNNKSGSNKSPETLEAPNASVSWGPMAEEKSDDGKNEGDNASNAKGSSDDKAGITKNATGDNVNDGNGNSTGMSGNNMNLMDPMNPNLMNNIVDPMSMDPMDPNMGFAHPGMHGNMNGNMTASNFDSTSAFNNNTLAGDGTKTSNKALNGVSTLLAEDDKWVGKKIKIVEFVCNFEEASRKCANGSNDALSYYYYMQCDTAHMLKLFVALTNLYTLLQLIR
jgi:hypothetical protein